ncbi:hypothetical protein T459_20180 [Capsicum annuum]|uniref:Uncharacterized protein n=1 Tax=Capsicum annuum TaxID=4072 RepID=A0A2G2Z3T0_CAPAN|nr:hypothetical protein FXO37_24694 [Capsicum annuum]PHT76658.1 hypothetical protein T459_20180 [Capsicum annuum]
MPTLNCFFKKRGKFQDERQVENGDVKLGLICRKSNGLINVRDNHYEQIKEKLGLIVNGYPAKESSPKP